MCVESMQSNTAGCKGRVGNAHMGASQGEGGGSRLAGLTARAAHHINKATHFSSHSPATFRKSLYSRAFSSGKEGTGEALAQSRPVRVAFLYKLMDRVPGYFSLMSVLRAPSSDLISSATRTHTKPATPSSRR